MFCQGFSVIVFFTLKHIFSIKKLLYNTHQVRYHFFIVVIIVESVNLIEMSEMKIIIIMMETN